VGFGCVVLLAALGIALAQPALAPFNGSLTDVAKTVSGAHGLTFIGSSLPKVIFTAIQNESRAPNFRRGDVLVSSAGLASAKSLCVGRVTTTTPTVFIWSFPGPISSPVLAVSREGENSVFLKGPLVEGRVDPTQKTVMARGGVLVQNLGAQSFGAFQAQAVLDASC
jgi:hypothetical protein